MPDVRLREVRNGDLDAIFSFQSDPVSVEMVGIGTRDRDAFDEHWARIRVDTETTLRTIEADGEVAGWALVFPLDGLPMAGYWLGRDHWGRGIASAALAQMLALVTERPLWATVLASNRGSRRVLEKNGFTLDDDGGEECRYVLR